MVFFHWFKRPIIGAIFFVNSGLDCLLFPPFSMILKQNLIFFREFIWFNPLKLELITS